MLVAPGIPGFTLPPHPSHCTGLTDKLIVGLGSPQLLIPLQHNTPQSMKLQYNGWAAKKRGGLARRATGRNLLLPPSLHIRLRLHSSLQLLVGRNRAAQIKWRGEIEMLEKKVSQRVVAKKGKLLKATKRSPCWVRRNSRGAKESTFERMGVCF